MTEGIKPGKVVVWTLVSLLVLVIIVGLGVGGCAGIKSFNQTQRRADANNQVQVTRINIRNAQQQAKVTAARNNQVKALAEQRYLQSVGIRRAQDEIAKTLTPLYVQHEAIEAQRQALDDGNAQIYIPSGDQGIPLVRNTTPEEQDKTVSGSK